MSKFLKIMIVLLTIAAVAAPAMAVEFAFHGDLNNRFNLYTNHSNLFTGSFEKSVADQAAGEGVVLGKKTNANWAETKYRFWTEATTNDGKVKGVFAVEMGGIHFGDSGSKSGDYSGDGVNIETRWLYTQFQLPNATNKALVTIGLQPYKINKYLWAETAMGIKYTADMFELAWMRGNEIFNETAGESDNSADSFSARVNLKPADSTKVGLFALYQTQDPAGATTIDAGTYEIKQMKNVKYNIYTLGVDGKLTSGDLFVNWDAMYQGGSFDNVTFTGFEGAFTGDVDLSAYFLHADVGVKLGDSRITFTTYYASGDDNDNDDKSEAFISTDVDMTDSVVLFEGGYADDNVMTERPYLFNKGIFLNKLAYDRKQSEKLKFGVAVLYLLTAEDLFGQDEIGTEFDAYVSYKLYPNVELALNGGYLITGDFWNAFETADADDDIIRITSRIRYKF